MTTSAVKYAACIVVEDVVWYALTPRVLVCYRKDGTGKLGLPGGKLDNGETSIKAAMRELREETGFDVRDPSKLKLIYEAVCEGEVPYYTFCYRTTRDNLSRGKKTDDEVIFDWVDWSTLRTNGAFTTYNREVEKIVAQGHIKQLRKETYGPIGFVGGLVLGNLLLTAYLWSRYTSPLILVEMDLILLTAFGIVWWFNYGKDRKLIKKIYDV